MLTLYNKYNFIYNHKNNQDCNKNKLITDVSHFDTITFHFSFSYIQELYYISHVGALKPITISVMKTKLTFYSFFLLYFLFFPELLQQNNIFCAFLFI